MEEKGEDMEICELDLERIEKAYADKRKGFVPHEKVSLLQEVITKAKALKPIGITTRSLKYNKRKF